ncbi:MULTISPECIES: DUF2213 domain-containing protein [Yersinia pseudotuberculosis complex]|uniref:Conserved domain protein n=1 Tax=Yersinia pseudotuberculosis serotype O:1b (strain IP 31758) TaxID=349747 RepID=A0A0U1R140_YERP3|nr:MULTISPECIES: DUF2213 domain-containing protein [Yersinia pseudotuberculosis complex]ABS48886.1 conserved domain protein [Yersinia pseudotuberculosis IP 31758]MCE4111723.1 DUF2213 domain-containing protein [Yersinia pseudotuberculosis]WLF02820.1 DUF2213 domain-containing protein [Yersinia pseudotuberculosis]
MSERSIDTNGWFESPNNPLSKVGIYAYLGKNIPGAPDPGKIYYVYRPEDELSDPACIDSFKLLPWTDDHPPGLLGEEDEGLTPAEEKGVQGVIGERVYYEDGVLYGNIKVFSQTMDELIRKGKKELSCGYRSKYEWQSGTYNGDQYDVIPANIFGQAQILTALQESINAALNNGVISVGKTFDIIQKLYITQLAGDDGAWQQVQNIGYWIDAVMRSTTSEEIS